jgi:AcrR family transcriptional regulator
MAKRNEHSLEEIKAMVLNAAETIIIEQGFSSLTIRKIAMEMGYTVGSIYMVFNSRADLILHINARTLEELITYLQPNTTGDIEQWIKAYLKFVCHNQHRWQMVFAANLLENKTQPEWYQAQLDEVFQQFAGYFTEVSPEQNAHAVQALWQGIQGICLFSPANDSEASVLILLRTFLRDWNRSGQAHKKSTHD